MVAEPSYNSENGRNSAMVAESSKKSLEFFSRCTKYINEDKKFFDFPQFFLGSLLESEFSLPKNPINFRCTKCGACCSDPRLFITVTVQDIHRWFLFGEELKTVLNVIGFYVFNQKEIELLQEKLLTIPLETEKGPAFIGMLRGAGGRCVMLDEEKKCKIYELRPLACRQFPIGISEDSNKRNTIIGISPFAVKICEGLGKGKRIKTEEMLELAKDTEFAIEGDKIFIGKWNEMVKNKEIQPSVENFLNFLRNAQNTHPELYEQAISKGINEKTDIDSQNSDKSINQDKDVIQSKEKDKKKGSKFGKYHNTRKNIEYRKKK